MKIGQQPIYDAKTETRGDEQIGFTSTGNQGSIVSQHAGFQCAQAGSTHRKHTATGRFAHLDGFHRFCRDMVWLGMHDMLIDILHAYRLEGSRSDMQRDVDDFHSQST